MKHKIYFLVLITLISCITIAQNTTDALRYSTKNLTGTARFNAMGGAFGSLGGDLSAVAINPAGSAVFLKNGGSISFNVSDNTNKASYFSTNSEANKTSVDFNQAGFVFVIKNPNQSSDWNKFSIGLNYITTQNFDQDLYVKGLGDTSVSNFFLNQAQGVPLDLLQLQSGETISDLYSFLGENYGVGHQNAFLGYQGFIFDPVDATDPNNTTYTSNIADGNFNQAYSHITRGFNAKYTFNFATQYQKKFYFGINLNSHTIDYSQYTYLEEENSNAGSLVNYVGFENQLNVDGDGFSAQAGIIAKILPEFRVSATYTSPTWYRINEETVQSLETERLEGNTNINTFINPRVLNIFQEYKLQTPSIFGAGMAYVFGTKGLISIDYSYKDYAAIKFKPQTDSYFANQNQIINNTLRATSTLKIGGEYNYDRWSFRGGFQYEESPYKNKNTLGDKTVFSTGLGYNFGALRLDLSYAGISQSRYTDFYDTGLISKAKIDTNLNVFTLTLGYNL